MNAIARVFSQVFSALGVHPPAWALPLVFGVIVALLWPTIQRNQSTGKARGLFRQSLREQGEERERLQREALELIKGNPNGFVAITEEALAKGDKPFAKQALEGLKTTGKMPHKVRRFTIEIEGEKPKIPEAEVLAVTRFLDEGLLGKAALRLAPALEEWPEHPELLDLKARLDRERDPAQG